MTHSPHRLRSKPTSWAEKFQELEKEKAGEPEPGFYTTLQWSVKIHRSTPQTQRLLRLAVMAGQAEVRMYKVQSGVFNRPVPHYRLTKPAQSGRLSSGKAS
jgi:hypothetical protein